MNQLDELFKAIESHEFSAIVNLASDVKTFERILSSEIPLRELTQQMRNAEVRTAAYQRALALVADRGEEGHEHRWDSALAAYLWLLADTDVSLARLVATRVAAAPGCWWARKMAAKVLAPDPAPSSAG